MTTKNFRLQIAATGTNGEVSYHPFDSFNKLENAIETAKSIASQSRVIDANGNEVFTTVR